VDVTSRGGRRGRVVERGGAYGCAVRRGHVTTFIVDGRLVRARCEGLGIVRVGGCRCRVLCARCVAARGWRVGVTVVVRGGGCWREV